MSINESSLPPGDKPDLVKFFSRFADSLLEFAGKHNLRVDKYWHDFPSWRFSFQHPKGGVACIEVMREGDEELKVYGYWWLDSYDEGARYSKKSESHVLRVSEIRMPDLLTDTLKQIISWSPDSWTEVVTGFKPHWSRAFSKEQFTRLADQYPVVKL